MDRLRLAGLLCTAAGVGAYAVGTAVSYPGRAFSLTAVMVGTTLLAIGNRGGPR